MLFFVIFISLFSALIALNYGTLRAFLSVFLPAFILFPQSLTAHIVGFPNLSLGHASLLTLFFVTLLTQNKIKFSVIDFLVLALIFCMSYAEYVAEHFGEHITEEKMEIRGFYSNFALARQTLFYKFTSMFIPYFLGKNLIRSLSDSQRICKRFVELMVVLVVISLLEFRLMWNPFYDLVTKVFQSPLDGEMLLRYGLYRVEGPFFKPLFYGTFITIALLFNYWLIKIKSFKYTNISLANCSIFLGLLIVGLFMTISRGPLMSAFLGILVAGIGFRRNRWYMFFKRGSVILGIAIFCISLLFYYSDKRRSFAVDGGESNIIYRVIMIETSLPVVMEKPFWGWGVGLKPSLGGIKSIDNHYLSMALTHGLISLGVFLLLPLILLIRLFRRGLTTVPEVTAYNSLPFLLGGLIISLLFGITTLYMTTQMEIVLFLLYGWSEGYLHSTPQEYLANRKQKNPRHSKFSYSYS